MISKQEVLHIAKLARLQLTEKEIENLQKDMSAILDYFDLLKKVPKVEVKTNFLTTANQRKDEVFKDNNVVENLIEQAPSKKDGYIKVKSILK